MVDKWSACSPFTATIQVRILLKTTFFVCNLFEKNENKQKEAGNGPFLTTETDFRSRICHHYFASKIANHDFLNFCSRFTDHRVEDRLLAGDEATCRDPIFGKRFRSGLSWVAQPIPSPALRPASKTWRHCKLFLRHIHTSADSTVDSCLSAER